MYVPDLSSTNLCDNHTRSLIPKNATRYSDLPTDGWTVVAVAPWTNADCVQSFLAEIRGNPAAIAVLFYKPGDSTSAPPTGSDPSWDIGDGGKWKSNPFPIYALAPAIGEALMHELSLYSGNMTDVPHGDQLVKMYDSRNYIRLYADIDVNNTASIPSLWEFLIIVLCILLAVVVTTSVTMHLFQLRRRRQLQSRVARGEVDLEALGIKRLNVPQNVLDNMPIHTYSAPVESTSDTSATILTTGIQAKPARKIAFSQPTCPICLDDFIDSETNVRELPCSHIFHPECIDPFLRDNSSLCPMCKKSTLPPGYCPVRVTNLMVRRERLIRRMRHRLPVQPSDDQRARRLSRAVTNSFNHIRRNNTSQLLPNSSPDQQPGAQAGATEMTDISPPPPSASMAAGSAAVGDHLSVEDAPPPEVRAQGPSALRTWRRERLARAQRANFSQTAALAEDTRPKCKLFHLINAAVRTDFYPRAKSTRTRSSCPRLGPPFFE